MRLSILALGVFALSSAASAAARPHHKTVTATTSHSKKAHASARHGAARGKTSARTKSAASRPATPGMDTERATQIQSALIKNGYLTGEASGHWDANSTAAMQKLQKDNGWQTKVVPDSRALIKLGLGPSPDVK